MLATACRRVGRHRQEAIAHFSSGVLHENSGDLNPNPNRNPKPNPNHRA